MHSRTSSFPSHSVMTCFTTTCFTDGSFTTGGLDWSLTISASFFESTFVRDSTLRSSITSLSFEPTFF